MPCGRGSRPRTSSKVRSSAASNVQASLARAWGLHPDSIGKLLKRAAVSACMKTGPLGGHSLGPATSRRHAIDGMRKFVIQRQTGHTIVSMLRRYIRSGEIFRENSAADIAIWCIYMDGTPKVTARENSLIGR